MGTFFDLEETLLRDDQHLTKVAHHEAGHAVAALAVGADLGGIYLPFAEGPPLLCERLDCSIEEAETPWQRSAIAFVALAGIAAERLMFAEVVEAWADFDVETVRRIFGPVDVERLMPAAVEFVHTYGQVIRFVASEAVAWAILPPDRLNALVYAIQPNLIGSLQQVYRLLPFTVAA